MEQASEHRWLNVAEYRERCLEGRSSPIYPLALVSGIVALQSMLCGGCSTESARPPEAEFWARVKTDGDICVQCSLRATFRLGRCPVDRRSMSVFQGHISAPNSLHHPVIYHLKLAAARVLGILSFARNRKASFVTDGSLLRPCHLPFCLESSLGQISVRDSSPTILFSLSSRLAARLYCLRLCGLTFPNGVLVYTRLDRLDSMASPRREGFGLPRAHEREGVGRGGGRQEEY